MNVGIGPKPAFADRDEPPDMSGEQAPLLEETSTIDERLAYLRSILTEIAESDSYQEAILSEPDLNVWSVEGTDGAGKTTLVPLLVEVLEEEFENVSECKRRIPKGTFERFPADDDKSKLFIARVLQLAALGDIVKIENLVEVGEITPSKALVTPNSIIRDLVYSIVRSDFNQSYLDPFIEMIARHGFPVGNVLYIAVDADTAWERIKARESVCEGDPKNLKETRERIKVYEEVLDIIENIFGANIFVVKNDEDINPEDLRDEMKRRISESIEEG
jgi:thymidylate kinase